MSKLVIPIKIGKTYYYWKVIKKAPGRGRWWCLCTGCNQIVRSIQGYRLRNNYTKSCGCKRVELLQRIIKEKYGVDNISSLPETKEKKHQTLTKNFGLLGLSHPDIRNKKCKTNLEKYGHNNPMKNKEIKNRTIFTNKEKYGKDYPTQTYQSRLNRGTLLKNGYLLTEYCELKKVPESTARNIYKNYGENSFIEWCDNYKGRRVFSTEAAMMTLLKDIFPQIEKYDCKPCGLPIYRRPDFRLQKNNRLLYLNIDGLYDHMQGGRRQLNKNYHKELYDVFAENNLTIFQFRSDELRDKKNIVKSIIMNFLKMTPKTIFARKCVIKKVVNADAERFNNSNHLMGHYKSSTGYGLYYNEELLALMCIRRKGRGLEIARFSNKVYTNVVGGFSKLLKYIEKEYNPSFIQSFLDLRYSTGKSYIKCGFSFEKVTLGWKWTDCHNTYNRLQCRANMDERGLSQKQHAEELKWYKIYDAGQAKYIKHYRR